MVGGTVSLERFPEAPRHRWSCENEIDLEACHLLVCCLLRVNY